MKASVLKGTATKQFSVKPLMFKRCLLVGAWAVLALSSQFVEAEALCNGEIPETTAIEVFEPAGDGEILHAPSGLIFMRCAIGQTWENETCEGNAQLFTWQQALKLSYGYEYNDSRNWRLPNIKELVVIAERSCVRPAVNEQAFPETPPDDFWTSTPSMFDTQRAWSVGFFNGTSSIKAKDRSIHIRLVRSRLDDE
jgi:hypothetical protein